ncbi:MAG: 3'-5' exonuclease, partial [Chitinophagia bacterium]|nr:3'-5' exonuclease [Chitinophagia bacterium]
DLNRIGRYCLQDVLTTAKVYLKLTGRPDMALNPVIVEG